LRAFGSRQRRARRVAGNRATPGRYFGDRSRFWLSLQTSCALATAEPSRSSAIGERIAAEVAGSPSGVGLTGGAT
jgi:hypothetical protein